MRRASSLDWIEALPEGGALHHRLHIARQVVEALASPLP